jgi:hypothetical protein
MLSLHTLHKKIINSNNRIIIKSVHSLTTYYPESIQDTLLQVLIETPSGDYTTSMYKISDTHPNLYIIQGTELKKLSSFYDLVHVVDGEIQVLEDYRLIQIHPLRIPCMYTSTIKKLVINNQYLECVNLNKLSLFYLDLKSNYLYKVIYDKESLLYCDLRNNKIKKCSIKSEILRTDEKEFKYNKKRHDVKESRTYDKHIPLSKLHFNIDPSPYIKYKVYNLSYRFYIVYKDIEDFKYILTCILRDTRNLNIVSTVEYIYKKLKKIFMNRGSFYIVCVYEDSVFIKTYRIRLVFDNYMRHEFISREDTYVYDNIGKWYVVPLINKLSDERLKVKDNLEYNTLDNHDILNAIINQSTAYVSDISLFKRCTIPSYKNLIKKYNKSSNKKITTSTKMVFMFIKFYETRSGTKSNIKKQGHLLNRLKTIRNCKIFEDNGTDGIIFMSQDTESILEYGLYIRKVFLSYKIDISIGIACGLYFFKVDEWRCKFMGNVLNTAARISYLGKGMYCCDCAVLNNHDRIYFQYVGEREVRGYCKCIKIYMVYYRNGM